jgi:MFS family permease
VAHGLLFASWTAHIPHIMRHLALTDGTLGFALLGAPVGSVAAMLLASYLVPKLGSRRVVQLALVGYCATAPLSRALRDAPQGRATAATPAWASASADAAPPELTPVPAAPPRAASGPADI